MNELALRCVKLTVPLTFLAAVLLLFELGTGPLGIRQALRLTARMSLLLFLMAFIARPLHYLRPSSLSAWLLRNRKDIGIAFGLGLTAHILLIAWLLFSSASWMPAPVTMLDILIGGPGLVIVIAMTISSRAAIRKRMGRALWSSLHTFGQYLVWFIFTACLINSFSTKSPPHPAWHYLPFIIALWLAMALRILASLRRQLWRGNTTSISADDRRIEIGSHR